MATPHERERHSSTLVKRVISGGALAALVVTGVLLLPAPGVAVLLSSFALLAAYEWAQLAGLRRRASCVAYVGALAAALVVLWWIPSARVVCVWTALGFWFVALAVAVSYPASAAALRPAFVGCVAGLVVLCGAWAALTSVSTGALLWLLGAVAAADTGAYFAGRRFGSRPLAPRASPGKTWEGAAGGALATLACGVLGAWLFAGSLVAWLAVALVIFLASVTGDLFESVLKRIRGVKDSGAILPGHGGVLDRIDSLVAAAPPMALLSPLLSPAPSPLL